MHRNERQAARLVKRGMPFTRVRRTGLMLLTDCDEPANDPSMDSLCLRCGREGHTASSCTQQLPAWPAGTATAEERALAAMFGGDIEDGLRIDAAQRGIRAGEWAVSMPITPEERAAQALANGRTFCNLLASARNRQFPGWWDGSAFRRHPCGVIEGAIKLTNHWHVDDMCDVQITDGSGWDRRVSHDSFGHGDPHPHPLDGSAVTVWQNGRWRSSEFREALEPKLLDLLTRAARHVEKAEARERCDEEERSAKAEAQRRALELAALANATRAQP